MTQDMWQSTSNTINRAVDSGTTLAADRVEHYESIVRETIDTLRQRDEPQAAEALERVAAFGSSVATYLRNADGKRLLRDAEEFTRGRTPVLTAVGAVTGFAVARALRAGATQRNAAADRNAARSPYAQAEGARG